MGAGAQAAGYFGVIIVLLWVLAVRLGDAGHLRRRHLHHRAEQGAAGRLHRRAGHGLEPRPHLRHRGVVWVAGYLQGIPGSSPRGPGRTRCRVRRAMAALGALPQRRAADRQRAEAKQRQSANEVFATSSIARADFCKKQIWGMLRSFSSTAAARACCWSRRRCSCRRRSEHGGFELPGRQGHDRRHGEHRRQHRGRLARRRVHRALRAEANAACSWRCA